MESVITRLFIATYLFIGTFGASINIFTEPRPVFKGYSSSITCRFILEKNEVATHVYISKGPPFTQIAVGRIGRRDFFHWLGEGNSYGAYSDRRDGSVISSSKEQFLAIKYKATACEHSGQYRCELSFMRFEIGHKGPHTKMQVSSPVHDFRIDGCYCVEVK